MIIDGIIAGVLLISAVISFFRGIIKEVLTIFGLGGAAAGAFLLGGKTVGLFESWIVHAEDEDYKYFKFIPDDLLAIVASYAAVFVVIFIALAVLSHFLSKGAEAMGLGPVDRSLGVLFGLLRGFLIVGIVYLSFSIFYEDGEFPTPVQESKLVPVIDVSVDWSLQALGLQKPFEDEKQDAKKIKTSIDTIDQVRDSYIDPKASKGDPAKKNTKGYQDNDRQALDQLIEKGNNERNTGASQTGGNP